MFSYVIGKIMTKMCIGTLSEIFVWIGAFWQAYLIYFFQIIIFIDIIRLINQTANFFPKSFTDNPETTKLITALIVLIIASCIIIYGFLNSEKFKVVEYTFEINKILDQPI